MKVRTFSLGAGKDTVVFGASKNANGEDTITNFTAGASGDVLKVSAFTAKKGDLQFANASSAYLTVGEDTANSIGVLFNDDDGEIASSDVKTSGSSAGDIIVADGKKAVVLVTTGDAGTTSANTYNVYYVTGSNSTATVELVGSVSTDAAALVIGNFA